MAVEVSEVAVGNFVATRVRVVRWYSLVAKEFVALDRVLHLGGAARRHLKPRKSLIGVARHSLPIQPVDAVPLSILATCGTRVPSRRIATGQVGAHILVPHIMSWHAVGTSECEAGEGLVGGALHTVPVEISIDLLKRMAAGCGEN